MDWIGSRTSNDRTKHEVTIVFAKENVRLQEMEMEMTLHVPGTEDRINPTKKEHKII
jgi:hypothetical protein